MQGNSRYAAKVQAYIDEICPHLNNYKIPLAPAQATELCELFGYENVLNYVARLGNYQAGQTRYVSVYLTLRNWMGEDLRKGSISLYTGEAEEDATELDALRTRFIIEYPPGSDFYLNGRKLGVSSDGNFVTALTGYDPIKNFIKNNIDSITKLLNN